MEDSDYSSDWEFDDVRPTPEEDEDLLLQPMIRDDEEQKEEEKEQDLSSPPVSRDTAITDFIGQVNELQQYHERERASLEEAKREYEEQKQKLEEANFMLEEAMKVKVQLEAEVALGDQDLQNMKTAAFAMKNDISKLLVTTRGLKRRLAVLSLKEQEESAMIEKEHEKMESLKQETIHYFDEKTNQALYGKRDTLEKLTTELRKLEDQEILLDGQRFVHRIEALQQTIHRLYLEEMMLSERVTALQERQAVAMMECEEARMRYDNMRGMLEEDLSASLLRNTALGLRVSAAEESVSLLNKSVAQAEQELHAKREAAIKRRRELFSVSF